ncbi:hypothetical protein ACFQZT_25810 [Paenibacillus sp. GCM10027628]|uniref:hypothetical protein n=1 Tax=Paenibacillus sp. GCM10027628 TaxID=3273413 RepID=UPI0036441816
MKSIKLTDVIRIIKPEYVFLKLKPNSIRNNYTQKLARTISSLYKNVMENVKKEYLRAVRVLGRQFFIPSKISH